MQPHFLSDSVVGTRLVAHTLYTENERDKNTHTHTQHITHTSGGSQVHRRNNTAQSQALDSPATGDAPEGMEDPSSDDCLPPGWTVEVKVRKNGKRDKYYFSPESGLKFNSKVEVFRHLDNAQKKASIQRVADNVVVEKGVAEGLPAGWMKKTRVTTKGDTVRKDSYYIDPVSGYAFRSLKDVDRYLESGEIGRNAFRPKDSGDMEFKADKFSSVGVTSKPTLSGGMGLSSDLNLIANDQQVQKPACSGEYVSMPISENISPQCVLGTALTTSVLLQAEGSDQKEVKVGLAESALVPAHTDEESQEKQLQANEQTKHGNEKAQDRRRKRHKKEINLPRRSSKRLAGIQVDPVPELTTRSRARRAAAKQSSEGDAIQSEDNCSNSLLKGAAKQINALEGRSEIKCKSDGATNVEDRGSDKDEECFSFWPQENHVPMKEHVRVLEDGDKVDAKLDYSLEFPRELLTDPCIAFAIQTLTGVTFETSKTSQVCAESTNCEHSETLAVAEGYGKKIKGLNMGDDKGRYNVFSHPENYAITQEHAGDAEIVSKANENTGSSSEKTLDISWMDPCIEFAIKTLTGSIPLDSDQNPKNCIQQQLSSSNIQHGEMALSSVNLDNICQTDYYRSQNFGNQKPMFKQPFVDPTPQHTRNVGIGNSAGARVPHCSDDSRNVC